MENESKIINFEGLCCKQDTHEQEMTSAICLDPNCKDHPILCRLCKEQKKHEQCSGNKILSNDEISILFKESEQIFIKTVLEANRKLQKTKDKLNQLENLREKYFQSFTLNLQSKGHDWFKQNIPIIRYWHDIKLKHKNQLEQENGVYQITADYACNLEFEKQLQTFFSNGIRILESNNFGKASEELTKIIKNLERHLSLAQLLQSITLLEMDNPEKGKNLIEEASFHNPQLLKDVWTGINSNNESKWTLILQSHALEFEKKFNEAEKICDKVLKIDKNNLIILCRKAYLLIKQGQYKESQTYLEKVLSQRKECLLANYYMGNVLQTLNQHEGAIKYYDQCLQRLTNNCMDVLNSKGVSLIIQKKYDEARKYFEKALLADNNNSCAHFNYALTLEQQKQFDSAIFHYNQAIKINLKFSKAYENCAYLLSQKEQNVETIQICKQAQENCKLDQNQTRKIAQWLREAVQRQKKRA